jgi:hypothetical protein
MKSASGRNQVAAPEKVEKIFEGKVERINSRGSRDCMAPLSDMRGRGAGLKISVDARPMPAAIIRLIIKKTNADETILENRCDSESLNTEMGILAARVRISAYPPILREISARKEIAGVPWTMLGGRAMYNTAPIMMPNAYFSQSFIVAKSIALHHWQVNITSRMRFQHLALTDGSVFS